MRQYKEAKESIPKDAVLLFRLGDFYEEFFEDAEKVSSALELVLTKRQGIPMCGFPHHALNNYLPRLVAAGLKVAIAEQMEDPKLAKGIVKRQITRIVTPGTLVEGDMLSSDCNNFLVAVALKDNNVSCMAAIDASTGEFFYSLPKNSEQFLAELTRLGAREILVASSCVEEFKLLVNVELPQDTIITELDNYDFDREDNIKLLCEHFHSQTLDGFGLRDYPQAAEVGGALLRYITNNLRGEVNHITWFEHHSLEKRLELIEEYSLAGAAFWKYGFETKEVWDLIIKYIN
jgi:DNA mismatch repair protein MutS